MSIPLKFRIFNPNDEDEYIDLGFEGIMPGNPDHNNMFIVDDVNNTLSFKLKSYEYNYGQKSSDKLRDFSIILGQPTVVSDYDITLTSNFNSEAGEAINGYALYMDVSYPERYKEYDCLLKFNDVVPKVVEIDLSIKFRKWEYKSPSYQHIVKAETTAKLKMYLLREDKVFVFIPTGQNNAVKASDEDLQRDKNGFTNPYLHRRINEPSVLTAEDTEQGIVDYNYKLGIYGTNSYRTTEIITHDEESETSEIP